MVKLPHGFLAAKNRSHRSLHNSDISYELSRNIGMDVEEEFNEAADFVGNSSGLSDKILLRLYGLYKLSTIGPCMEPQPSIFNMKARSKWTAWTEVSTLSKDEAMSKYIQVVKESTNWESSLENEPSSGRGGGLLGTGVSSFAIPDENNEALEDSETNPVFAWAKDCDVEKLRDWSETRPSEINVTDSNGLTPLHWAVDRGHLAACQLLLSAGADPNCQDNDGTTPLEYAETCEHEDIIVLLRQSIK